MSLNQVPYLTLLRKIFYFTAMKKVNLIIVLILCAIFSNAQNQTATKTSTSRVRIKINELPREITTVSMGTDHLGYAIKEAYRITQGRVKNYEIHITNGSIFKSLLYDNNGKIIKLLETKPAITSKTDPSNAPIKTFKPAAPPPAIEPAKK
jgi:hypothetical protein